MGKKGYEVKFENNANVVLTQLKNRERLICYSIGLKWETIVKKIITVKDIVDTGALRNSMTFFIQGSGKSITVGSRLNYARKQELYNKKGNFLKPSILEYRDVYKDIAEQILKK